MKSLILNNQQIKLNQSGDYKMALSVEKKNKISGKSFRLH